MKNKTKFTVINYIVAILALGIAGFIALFLVEPQMWLRASEKKIMLSDIEIGETYTGKKAGDDIARLKGIEQFSTLYSMDYITVEPSDVVFTGIYELKNWVRKSSTYSSYKKYSQGRKAEVVDNVILALFDYNEYYLIQLPDGTYIPALFEKSYANAIRKGKKVTLPIGVKILTKGQAKSYLEKICQDYSASSQYTLYMFHDEWYKKNNWIVLLIRAAIGVVSFFLLAIGGDLVARKLCDIKKEER